MSNTKPNINISAFPLTSEHYHVGMTLRDWFAGKILQGLLANGIDKTTKNLNLSGYGDLPIGDGIVVFSYRIADAMMEEREK